MGVGVSYGGLSYLGSDCPASIFYNIYYVYKMIYVWLTFTPFIHLSVMFLSTECF